MGRELLTGSGSWVITHQSVHIHEIGDKSNVYSRESLECMRDEWNVGAMRWQDSRGRG